jgi:nucleotide-binding universal stress UspA family protein
MNILVGVTPDDAGEDALALAAVLARLTDARIVLTHIYPPPFEFPSLTSVDAEWRAFVQERAEFAVAEAAQLLATDWSITHVSTETRANPSRGRGLLAAAKDHDARVIVIGPAPSGRKGALSLGSVADRLLHNSSATIALAPEGYRETAPEFLRRLVVACRPTDESELAAHTALRLATPHGLSVELLTPLVSPSRVLGSRVPRDTERAFMERLTEHEREVQAAVIATLGRDDVTGVVTSGDTTDRALARYGFTDEDLLVLASSNEGPLHRVVLGDMTHRMLRHCDVPAMVLPRSFSLRPEKDNA